MMRAVMHRPGSWRRTAAVIRLRPVASLGKTHRWFSRPAVPAQPAMPVDGGKSGSGQISHGKSEAATASEELPLQGVIKVYSTVSPPNYSLPWQNKPMKEVTGSGWVTSGHRIVTNAHVVADQKFVMVRKHGSPDRVPAKVRHVDCVPASVTCTDTICGRLVAPRFWQWVMNVIWPCSASTTRHFLRMWSHSRYALSLPG
jgi:hypothetical protein